MDKNIVKLSPKARSKIASYGWYQATCDELLNFYFTLKASRVENSDMRLDVYCYRLLLDAPSFVTKDAKKAVLEYSEELKCIELPPRNFK